MNKKKPKPRWGEKRLVDVIAPANIGTNRKGDSTKLSSHKANKYQFHYSA